MVSMFILLSHELTAAQYEDARRSLNVSSFVVIEDKIWSQIPADEEDISPYLETIKHNILQQAKADDIILVQGDFGATLELVNFAFKQKLIPVYATTQRRTSEVVQGDKIITTRTFEHVRFRRYKK